MKRMYTALALIPFYILLYIDAACSDTWTGQLMTENRIFPFCLLSDYKKSNFVYYVKKALLKPVAVTRLTDTYFINAIPLYAPHHLTMMVAYEKQEDAPPKQLHVLLSTFQAKKKRSVFVHCACLIGTTLDSSLESSSESLDHSTYSFTFARPDNKELLSAVRESLIASEFRVRSVCDTEQETLDTLGFKSCNRSRKRYRFFTQQQSLLAKQQQPVTPKAKKMNIPPLKTICETAWDDCSEATP